MQNDINQVYLDYITIIESYDLVVINITPFFNKNAFIKKLPRPCCLVALKDYTLVEKDFDIYQGELTKDKVMFANLDNLPDKECLTVIDVVDIFSVNKLREYFFTRTKVVLLNYGVNFFNVADFIGTDGIFLKFSQGLSLTGIDDISFFIDLFLYFAIYSSRPTHLVAAYDVINLVSVVLNSWHIDYQVDVAKNGKYILKKTGTSVIRLFGQYNLDNELLDEYQEQLQIFCLRSTASWKDRIKLIGYKVMLSWFFDFKEMTSEFKIRRYSDR